MRAINPPGWGLLTTGGMIRRIYVKLQITMLHNKYRNFGSKKIFSSPEPKAHR